MEQKSDTPKVDKKYYSNLMITGSLIIVLVALLFGLGVWVWIDIPEPGLFGDSFGGLTSVFSGLAFWGLIVTILMQMEELKITRDDFRENRKQFEKSAIAQEKTQEALNNQLSLMRMTSNIEALKHLIESLRKVGGESNQELSNHAEKMIIELGKQAIYSGNFDSILSPKLEVHSRGGHTPKAPNPMKHKGLYYRKYEVRNVGGEMTDLEWRKAPDSDLIQSGSLPARLPSGSYFEIEYTSSLPISSRASLAYKATFLDGRKYSQDLSIDYFKVEVYAPYQIEDSEE